MDDDKFIEIFKKVTDAATNYKDVEIADLIDIVKLSMEIVQKYPELKGDEKKIIVIRIMKKIVSETEIISEDKKELANSFIDKALPKTINLIVEAYKHKIDLKSVRNCCELL